MSIDYNKSNYILEYLKRPIKDNNIAEKNRKIFLQCYELGQLFFENKEKEQYKEIEEDLIFYKNLFNEQNKEEIMQIEILKKLKEEKEKEDLTEEYEEDNYDEDDGIEIDGKIKEKMVKKSKLVKFDKIKKDKIENIELEKEKRFVEIKKDNFGNIDLFNPDDWRGNELVKTEKGELIELEKKDNHFINHYLSIEDYELLFDEKIEQFLKKKKQRKWSSASYQNNF